jgi:hypothetical protein
MANNDNEKLAKEIVIARLETLPSNVGIAIGDEGEYTKEEIIKHIEKGDKLGKMFVDIDLEFLRALKTGELFK